MSGVYSRVGGLKPGLTRFSLGHSLQFDTDFGSLVPIACLEMVPGDIFRMDDIAVVGRLESALIAPVMGQFDVKFWSFFVPWRSLLGKGANFDTPVGEPDLEDILLQQDVSNITDSLPELETQTSEDLSFNVFGLSDYLGIQQRTKIAQEDSPMCLAWRAYRQIWNEYYRSSELMDEVQVCQYLGNPGSTAHDSDDTYIPISEYDALLRVCWRNDRFTSALPYQQFGVAPALPVTITGVSPVQVGEGNDATFWAGSLAGSRAVNPDEGLKFGFDGADYYSELYYSVIGSTPSYRVVGINSDVGGSSEAKAINAIANIAQVNNLVVSGSDFTASTFDVSDLRTVVQLQKWKERTARGGIRLTEYFKAHYGVSPSDGYLQRPYYIDGFTLPWMVSEVLQTSASVEGSTPQGNQAGQAIVLGRGKLGSFRAYEFGYCMILCSIVPKPVYQQGIPPMFSRKTVMDLFTPEFSHLSEQPIKNKELFYTDVDDIPAEDPNINNNTFGFTGIFNELRHLPSRVAGHMRVDAPTYSLAYWNLSRYFAESPVLNSEFLLVGGTEESRKDLMRIFEVQDQNPFVLTVGFGIKSKRPLPVLAEPGLVDHF